MEKNVIELLSVQNRTPEQDYLLVNALSMFFKPISTDFNLYSILPHLKLVSIQPMEMLYAECEKIVDYCVLLEGVVYLNKKTNYSERAQPQSILHGPSIIGQYFYSRSSVRQKRALCGDQHSKIIKINKRVFDEMFSKQIKEYRQVESFIYKHFGDLSKEKINIFDNFDVQNYVLNSKINLKENLYIIMRGECLMSFLKSKLKKNKNNQGSLGYNIHQNSFFIEKNDAKRKRLLILGENQWLFNGGHWQYQYSVISEKLTLIKVPLKLLPDLQEKAQKIQQERVKRNKKSLQKVQESEKVTQYESPTLIQKRGKQSQRILNSIDSSLNPGILRQKYLLGQSKFSNKEKISKNNSQTSQSVEQQSKKKEKIIVDTHPKSKDWSKYLKLPSIQRHPEKEKQKIIIKSIRS